MAIPDKLLVSSPFHAEHCSGSYLLLPDQVNGYPVWESTDGCHWIFSTKAGGWMISDESESLTAPDSSGLIASVGRHKGLMPHQIQEWQVGDGEGWHIDQSIGIALLPDVLSQIQQSPIAARASIATLYPIQSKVQSPARVRYPSPLVTSRVSPPRACPPSPPPVRLPSITPSAPPLEERLKLANLQVDTLLQQCNALEDESQMLVVANQQLTSDNTSLHQEVQRLREMLDAKDAHLKRGDESMLKAESNMAIMGPKIMKAEKDLQNERERAAQQEMETKEIVQKLLLAEERARMLDEKVKVLDRERVELRDSCKKIEREKELLRLGAEKTERELGASGVKLAATQKEVAEATRRAAHAEQQMNTMRMQLKECETALMRQSEAETDKQRLIRAEKEALELRGMPSMLAEAEKELKSVLIRLAERENELASLKRDQFHRMPSDTENSILVQPIDRNLVSPPTVKKTLSPGRPHDAGNMLPPSLPPATPQYSRPSVTPYFPRMQSPRKEMATPDFSRHEKNFIPAPPDKQDKQHAPIGMNARSTIADYEGGRMSPAPYKEDRCISPSAFKAYPQSRHCSPLPRTGSSDNADEVVKMWVTAPRVPIAEGLYIVKDSVPSTLTWVSNNDKWFIVNMDDKSRIRWFLVVGEGQGYSRVLNKVKNNRALLRSAPINSTSVPPYTLRHWEVNQSGMWQHDPSITIEKAETMY